MHAIRTKPDPANTVLAYKLFHLYKNRPGQIFTLYMEHSQDSPVPVGVWLDASVCESGNLAQRPGWHCSDLPLALHIGEKANPADSKPGIRPDCHVWAEVLCAADVDWQPEAWRRARIGRNGAPVASTAHITDQAPVDGFYRYKTNPNMFGDWIISGAIRVERLLSDREVERINAARGVADLPRRTPFDPARWGLERYFRPAAPGPRRRQRM